MARLTQWRVRVLRRIEAFVDVSARDAAEAETEAAKVPGVVSVFPKSALASNDTGGEKIRALED